AGARPRPRRDRPLRGADPLSQGPHRHEHAPRERPRAAAGRGDRREERHGRSIHAGVAQLRRARVPGRAIARRHPAAWAYRRRRVARDAAPTDPDGSYWRQWGLKSRSSSPRRTHMASRTERFKTAAVKTARTARKWAETAAREADRLLKEAQKRVKSEQRQQRIKAALRRTGRVLKAAGRAAIVAGIAAGIASARANGRGRRVRKKH